MKRKTIFTFKMSFMILIGLSGFKENIQAEESIPPLTHLEFLVELADSVWENCLDDVAFSKEHVLLIEDPFPGNGMGDWAIRRLETKCIERGLKIYTRPDSLRPDRIRILKPYLLNFSLYYPEWGRYGLFGRRWVERLGILHADIRCWDGSGLILFEKTYKLEKRDRLFADQFRYAEQNSPDVNVPAWPEFNDFLSRAEAWLMIGSITAVLYLFYIIRS